MIPAVMRNRFLVLRRATQLLLLFIFIAGNVLGWKVLRGSLSTSRLADAVTLADPFALLQIGATGNLPAVEALAGGLIVLLFFALIGGRSFCSWVCPINMVTDLANRLRGMMQPGPLLQKDISRNVRYWTLGLSLVLSAYAGIAAFEWISPISALQRGMIFGMGAGWTAVAAVFLFDLVLLRHGFCGHVCPLGGFYSLITRYSLIRVMHDSGKCTLCMKCIEHCPERQVLPMVGKATALVSSGECTNCGKCIEVCDDRAMRFGIRLIQGKP
jgi:ferredoxin-type protein NapH